MNSIMWLLLTYKALLAQAKKRKREVNIGDGKFWDAHHASTTHRQLAGPELTTAGVTQDMIRLCINIENIDDILVDLEQALAVSRI